MTPAEKAQQLINKYQDIDGLGYFRNEHSYIDWGTLTLEKQAKQCALIAVDEIQNTKAVYHNDTEYDYWEEVKQEIENN